VWALVGVVWLGPIVLQLASPVVPFIDVLPNYVAPAEHLRTFGWLSPLSATFSPIHGPSRSDLGYEGLLGSLATMGDLPATLALAAFILPSTLLVAAGVQRLATAVAGRGRAIGPWALLAFALTEPFARLGDARGTVIVLPLVALALALAAEAYRGDEDAWRPGRGLAMGVALGASILLHPVIGAFATATVALAALARPERVAGDALVAGIVALGFALPQAGIMAGVPVPPLVLGPAIGAAIAVGAVAARLLAGGGAPADAVVALARFARVLAIAAVVVGVALAGAAGALRLDRLPDALEAGWSLVVDGCGVLLVAVALGWLVGSPAARSVVLAGAVLVGLTAALVVELLPADLGFLGDALRFEVPKTVHYWLPVMVAVAVGPSLAAALDGARPPAPSPAPSPPSAAAPSPAPAPVPWPAPSPARLPFALGAAAVGVIVAVAAFPLGTGPIDAFHLGEHRFAESLAIDLRWAGNGFWSGFPDARQILDPPRREIADAIRAEIQAGRIGPETRVLHVASSFQQWVATPLGVVDGVVETFVSPDHEVSQQTVGGRLYGLESLDAFIASGDYPYAVLEPRGLAEASTVAEELLAAGYAPAFSNTQGTIYRLGG
jgi:hypothetical protein